MADKTGIQWTDATWNPLSGCDKVSPGCAHCYAETFANRWRNIPGHHYEKGFDFQQRPEMLDIPRHWKRPRRIFVNSMSDMFHPKVTFEYWRAVVGVMTDCPQHTFQILTKRASIMHDFCDGCPPPPNAWMGVSVENQACAEQRITTLTKTQCAVKFLSCEPLLGPVDLAKAGAFYNRDGFKKVDWVIVGGESGPGCRPMNPDWAKEIQRQCYDTDTAFFMKQMGGFPDKHGSNPQDFPNALGVRQFPKVKNA